MKRLYLLNRDKQSADIQYRKIVALNPLFSEKTLPAIYANLLVAAEK